MVNKYQKCDFNSWQIVAVPISPAGLLVDKLDVALIPQAEQMEDMYISTTQCDENYHREMYTVVQDLRGRND